MSLPKITTRPQRVVREEYDPYRGIYIRCKIYEDGSKALFVSNNRVCSIYLTRYRYSDPIYLYLVNGHTVSLHEVTIQECIWLQKSMEDTV